MISHENSFYQSTVNIQKNGAYYTDVEHCRRIGYLFDFEKAEEICCLEPSAGDGQAVLAVTGENGVRRKNLRLFLVELNPDTYNKHLKENSDFDFVLNTDFLNGVKISNGKFSFSFANWPYGVSKDGKSRFETQFLTKQMGYMQYGSYLAAVVPFVCLQDDEFCRKLLAYFEVCGVWKFDDKVYSQFKQLVIVAKKKVRSGYLAETYENFVKLVSDLDNIGYLPKTKEEVSEPFVVRPSYEKEIVYFTKLEFKPGDYADMLDKSLLMNSSQIMSRIFVPKYDSNKKLNPVMPLTKDMSYICAVQGLGEGITGSIENKDLHLQRGVIKVVTDNEIIMREKEDEIVALKVVEKTHSKMYQYIVENSGKITKLG